MDAYEALKETFDDLFQQAVEEGCYTEDEATELVESLDIYSLLQVVRHNATTVYSYITQGRQERSFNYRGEDLFRQKATLLYEETDQVTMEIVVATRTLELWLLEDMSLAVVSCVSVNYDHDGYALADTSDAVRSQLKEIKKTEEKYFNQINYIRRLLHSICVEKSDEEKANYSKQEDSSSQPFDLQDINERLYNFLLLLPEWYLSDCIESSPAAAGALSQRPLGLIKTATSVHASGHPAKQVRSRQAEPV